MALSDEVKQLVSNVIGIPAEELSNKSSIETMENWDSMAHVNIIMSLEQHYAITIAPDIAADLTSITSITDFLTEKLER